MKNIVVVGSQWGDEGKGKIVDWLSELDILVVGFELEITILFSKEKLPDDLSK